MTDGAVRQNYFLSNTVLGQGAFATVYKGKIKETSEIVAIKVFKNQDNNIDVESEVRALM